MGSGNLDVDKWTLALADKKVKFRALAAMIAASILRAELEPGIRLPSERALAAKLGTSRITVTAAYQELHSRGIVRSYVGRGTFVCAGVESSEPFAWSGKISTHAQRMRDPIVPELLQDRTSPSMISFTTGTPALSSFPTNAYRTAIDDVLRWEASTAIGVGPTAGLMSLREAIAARMNLCPQNVFILSGAQQGLDLIARCFIDVGDAVIADEPCFPGTIQALQAAGAVIHGWNVERWDVETLESLIVRYKPKMLYTNPTLQNPTGHSMSLDKRRDLLALAARYRLPIIEDDIHSNLSLEAAPPPPIVSLDRKNIVVYLNSFSKCLGPGIRIGWLVSSPFIVRQLSLIKMRANLFTEGLGQLAMLRLIKNGEFDRHLERLRLEHRLRAGAALQTMKQQFPPCMLSWTRPKGGLYIWCRLHNGMTTSLVQKHAQTMNVSFAPGHLYFPQGNHHNYFRLCFAALPAEKIVTGITRLAAAVKRAYREHATQAKCTASSWIEPLDKWPFRDRASPG